MIILYVCFSNLRKSSRGYFLMINICDFVTSACFFLSSFHNRVLDSFVVRQIEGFCIQFFYLSSFFWTACYSFHLYQLVVFHKEVPTRHYGNHLVAWVIPLITVIWLFILECTDLSAIGDCDRPWPWISNELDHAFYYQLGFLYIPIALIVLFNMIIYICIGFKSKGEDLYCFILLRSFAYIAIAVFVIIWDVVDRVFMETTKHHAGFSQSLIALSVPSLGFLNVCVYSLNKYFFSSFKSSDSRKMLEESLPLTN
ncbi:hypothetical protein WA171_000821 [Blastocystis sp. BT1]